MKNRFTGPRALAVLLGGLFAGCLQDPGQTGLGYLNEQGVKLSAPLYHFSFENLPMDSVFTSEVTLDHYGDSLVVVGRQPGFSATTRMGFALTTEAQHRHMDTGVALRLVPLRMRGMIGKEFLSASVQNRDSLTLLVHSYSWIDTGGNFQDSLNLIDRKLLRARTTFEAYPLSHRRLDTVRISPKSSYLDSANQDSSQVVNLPHLRERLRSIGDSTNNWVIVLEISPLAGSGDSGMYRFASQTRGNSTYIRRYGSGLWLGRYKEDSVTTVGSLLTTYFTNGFPGSNYTVQYTGSSTQSLLLGVTRGIHMRLNRDTLLTRIKAALYAIGDSARADLISTSPSGKFDRRFYVPYAELRLPLSDSLARVDGPFAFDLSVLSDVDSVADGEVLGNVAVALGTTLPLSVLGGPDYSSNSRDTLRVSYLAHPQDTSLRLVTLAWDKNTVTDTITLTPNGIHREVAVRLRSGWLRQSNVTIIPNPSSLSVGVHFSAQSILEPNSIKDSTGLKNVSTNAGLQRRFYRPGADSLTIRTTRAVGQLLNRTSSASISPDIYLRAVDRPAYDTSTVGTSTYNRVPFPVFGEIELPRGGDGKLRAGLDLYLFPLEGGQ